MGLRFYLPGVLIEIIVSITLPYGWKLSRYCRIQAGHLAFHVTCEFHSSTKGALQRQHAWQAKRESIAVQGRNYPENLGLGVSLACSQMARKPAPDFGRKKHWPRELPRVHVGVRPQPQALKPKRHTRTCILFFNIL